MFADLDWFECVWVFTWLVTILVGWYNISLLVYGLVGCYC